MALSQVITIASSKMPVITLFVFVLLQLSNHLKQRVKKTPRGMRMHEKKLFSGMISSSASGLSVEKEVSHTQA